MRGTVKWFNEQKGYGFVTGEDGSDAFVHINSVPEDAILADGARVEYETEHGPKGTRVTAIKLLAAMLLAAMLTMATAATPGCSDLQARGQMAAAIDTNAKAAAEIRPAAMAGTLTVDTCIVTMVENAEKFGCYAASKTTNWFSYAFGDKTIWCSPVYARLLDETAELARHTPNEATTKPAAWCNAVVLAESNVLIKIKQAKDGKAE